MIPADPTSSGPGPMLQHVTTLQNDFRKFDTAKQNKDADADNIVSRDDFKAVVADKSGRFSQADVEAAQFFLDHPDAFARLDTAAASDNSPGVNEEPDGRIGQLDVQAGVRDASDFDGAATFTTQQPALPTDHANQAQQDADLLLHLQTAEDQNDPGLEPHEAEQTFTQLLQQHHGDVGYLHDLFGALGARAGGRALYQALGTEGQSRTQARDAIDTLRNNGLLTDKELAAAQFKTAPDASAGFSLKTLLGADQVQRQVTDHLGGRGHLHQPAEHPVRRRIGVLDLLELVRQSQRDGLLAQVGQLATGDFVVVDPPGGRGQPGLEGSVDLADGLPVGLQIADRLQVQAGVALGVVGGCDQRGQCRL